MGAILHILTGTDAAKFGTIDETEYIIENITESVASEETILEDGQGDPHALSYHGKKGEIQGSFKIKKTGYPAQGLHGSGVTLTDTEFDGTYIIYDTQKTRENKGWMGGQFTARRVFQTMTTTTTTTTTT